MAPILLPCAGLWGRTGLAVSAGGWFISVDLDRKQILHLAIFKNRVMDKLPADSETESWQRRNEIKEKKRGDGPVWMSERK